MKKKIRFLDYYIDEWHANEYPKMPPNTHWNDEFEISSHNNGGGEVRHAVRRNVELR